MTLNDAQRHRPLFLASVRNAVEARQAAGGGADIIDCKDPETGALGALAPEAVREIMTVCGEKPVSATIGDLPNDPASVVAAAQAMAETGLHAIKWGLFEREGAEAVIRALGRDVSGTNLVAVMMADRDPDFSLIPVLADAGFTTVMLDTADKCRGSLRDCMAEARLVEFVGQADACRLSSGLAGSLRVGDIVPLLPLNADILGFRGALCGCGRTSEIDAKRVLAVRKKIDDATPHRSGVARHLRAAS